MLCCDLVLSLTAGRYFIIPHNYLSGPVTTVGIAVLPLSHVPKQVANDFTLLLGEIKVHVDIIIALDCVYKYICVHEYINLAPSDLGYQVFVSGKEAFIHSQPPLHRYYCIEN